MFFVKSHLFSTNLQYFVALRQLKHIDIELKNAIVFKTMINTFAQNEVPIELMQVNLSDKNPKIDPFYQLSTIKT